MANWTAYYGGVARNNPWLNYGLGGVPAPQAAAPQAAEPAPQTQGGQTAAVAAAPVPNEPITAANKLAAANMTLGDVNTGLGGPSAADKWKANAQAIAGGLRNAGVALSTIHNPYINPAMMGAPNGSGGMPGGGQDQLSSAVNAYLNPQSIRALAFYGLGQ